MRTPRWRWKKTRIVIEAAIIGTLAALLIILFTETGVERQYRSVAPDAGLLRDGGANASGSHPSMHQETTSTGA